MDTIIIGVILILMAIAIMNLFYISSLINQLKEKKKKPVFDSAQLEPAPPIEEMLAHEVEFPKETDYHGHSNYFKVYVALLILFGLSLFASFIHQATLMLLAIFSISLMKSVLVVGRFMHLKWEAKLLWVAVGIVVFILCAFFFGVFPDIVWVERNVVNL